MSLDSVQEALGYEFVDLSMLEKALTHSSYAHENRVEDYERLEFLGDAVLQMCTTLLLMEAFPKAREGQLSRLRSKLVNTRMLAEIGRVYAPFLLANAAALAAGDERVECEIDGRPWVQQPFPYQGKCLQWLRDDYARLDADARGFVDATLSGTGCETLFANGRAG